MKALVLGAEWKPKPGYEPCPLEKKSKIALNGNLVWRNPKMELKELPMPEIADDQVLIRVKACGICGSDTHFYETDEEGYIKYSGPTKFPCTIGHEFSGTVEEIGKDVETLQVGDSVVAEGMMWCGRCFSCRSGLFNHCEQHQMIGFSVDGACAEYIAIEEKYCWEIGDLLKRYEEDRAYEAGALIEPTAVAYNGIFTVGGGIGPGAYVAIYGLGPIGLAAVALSKSAGASQIIGFDKSEGRVVLAREMRADFTFNPLTLSSENSSPSQKIMEVTSAKGADIQIEAAGAPRETLPWMEEALALKGRIIYLGRSTGKASIFLDTLVAKKGTIYGLRGHSGSCIFPQVIRLMASGQIDMTRIITARFPLSEAIEAIKRSSSREDGKIMIRI